MAEDHTTAASPATEPAALAVTVATAARLLGISRATAYRLVSDSTIGTVRLRSVVRVPMAEIERLLDSARPVGYR